MKTSKNYQAYPFMNLSLENLPGEKWKDIPELDGAYSVSNMGRIYAYPRPVLSTTGHFYLTKERVRKQTLNKILNTYTQDYTEQLSIRLRYNGSVYSYIVSRLVYNFFVQPLDVADEKLFVVHKDGDNCNNISDNLVLMDGTQLYVHGLQLERRPRAGKMLPTVPHKTFSETNFPRPIVKYNLVGKKIAQYASVGDAARADNTTRGNVRNIATGRLMQSHGFVYRFKGDPYHGEHKDFSYEKEVTQYSIAGKRIRSFPSLKDAALVEGLQADVIGRCARRKILSYKGFVWRYKGDTYHGEYHGRIKNGKRSVVQYSIKGDKLATFGSLSEASRSTGFTVSTLRDCAHKKTRVAHGYVWRFLNEEYHGEYKDYRIGRQVTQYLKDGKKVRTFETIQAAADGTGLTAANIHKNVTGKNFTAGGYVWKYASESEIRRMSSRDALLMSRKVDFSSPSSRVVKQYSPGGKLLKVYKSVSEAARSTGLNNSNISFVIDKPARMSGGFVWRSQNKSYRGEFANIKSPSAPKVVTQYDLRGSRIAVFESTRKAEAKTGIPSSSILAAANGRFARAGGYLWRMGSGDKQLSMKDNNAHNLYRKKNSKTVQKFSIDGKFMAEYGSIREAARAEGFATARISNVLAGKSRSAGGYIWKLKEELRRSVKQSV
jgi:hypothetical protein